MSRKTANNLDALTNTELRELLGQHGFPNQPVTNSTRSVLISRLRKSMLEPASQSRTRHTSYNPAKYSSAEESDRESAAESKRNKQTSISGGRMTSSTASNMPPPAATTKRKRATMNQQASTSYSVFSPSSSSSVSYSGTTGLPSIKVPIQSRSSVYIPPPTVHNSSDTEESDSNTGGSASRNPYLSYGRLSGLSFPKRYSPAPESNHSPQSSIRTSFNSGSPVSVGQTSRVSDGSSSGAEESPYVSDFTKRLLQFRQEPVERRATTTATANQPLPNPRYTRVMSEYSIN